MSETNVAQALGWTPPPGWPAMSRDAIQARLTAPGERFEMELVDIRGVPTRTWKNAPENLRALMTLARTHGTREFVIYESERVTYAAFHRAVARLAVELQARGAARGDRVALAMRNLPEWPVAFFAAVSIGAICVPLNAWWTGGELAYGLADSGTSVLICDAERWDRIAPHVADIPTLRHVFVSRGEPGTLAGGAERLETLIGAPATWADLPDADLPNVPIAADDDATIFYTSGTTGNPKGALGTHRNLVTNIFSSAWNAVVAALRRGEVPPDPVPRTMLTVIPLFHVTACSAGLMGAVAAGHTLVYMRRWDPVQAFQVMERERVNVTGGVPTIAWQLLEHPARAQYDLSSLEAIAYGGAPSAPELVRKIRDEFGALPSNGWGMTETMATVTGISAEDYLNRPTSCGPPVAVADLRIMSEDGARELPAGEVGELWARGPMVVKGYWNKPEATAETFVDGWVRTGDLARLDAEGFCYIVDRAKDMILRGGENIYSSEVENVLYDHPAVTDAALVGIPHHTLGEEPAAVVHLAPGTSASEAELQAWVAERLARFKVPVRVLFTEDTLPRNANGKILKKDLKALFEREPERL
ncbi:AMP-binding protein [Altererythrobacter aerius]|uniref:3-methylmercaptopropionyl-CoA ligase n=1 Tax=Tsuneonella aeria TaxID=1837929 RepID=A0A6I4TAN8_9SPHN|nr:class I adenylate-forming enzyme family protein [Tsuneonella aeria]MXO74282.1 AMP-binding protein [Tsuneonella aeria]